MPKNNLTAKDLAAIAAAALASGEAKVQRLPTLSERERFERDEELRLERREAARNPNVILAARFDHLGRPWFENGYGERWR